MKVTSKLIRKDRGLQKILKNLSKSGQHVATVGLHQKDNETYKGGANEAGQVAPSNITYASLGHIFELGIGQPQRSWLRGGLESNMSELKKTAEFALKEVVAGRMTQKVAMKALGEEAQGGILTALNTKGEYEANSDETIKRKGSNLPLTDTGVFKSKIKAVVSKA